MGFVTDLYKMLAGATTGKAPARRRVWSISTSEVRIYEEARACSSGRFLLIFPHGLGDLINFLPIVRDLRAKLPHLQFHVGTKSDYSALGDYFYKPSALKQLQEFKKIFLLHYSEPPLESWSKPDFCNEVEVGLPDFQWRPLSLERTNAPAGLVGVHFFGTSRQDRKSLSVHQADTIWAEIEEAGFVPFEVHNSRFNPRGCIGHDFVRTNSLRQENPTLERMIAKISECRYFVGIESGPFYLAGSILGFQNCLGIQLHSRFQTYAPVETAVIDATTYRPGAVKQALQGLAML